MIVLWLLVGIASVSIAFFMPGNSPELWPGLNASAIPLIVYLLALLLYTLRTPITLRARVVAWIVSVAVGAATCWSWVGMDREVHWQHDQLLRIREVIVRGLMQAQVPAPMLKTLEAYHRQGATKKESLRQIFQRLNDRASVGTNIHKSESPADSLTYVVSELDDGRIVVMGLHAYCKGRNPEFKNYDGRTGMVQVRCTLTEKGVNYESEN